MTKDEALKLALEALEEAWYHVGTFQPTEKAIDLYDEARTAIKESLMSGTDGAQPEHGWTSERIAGIARLKEAQDKRLAQPEQEPYWERVARIKEEMLRVSYEENKLLKEALAQPEQEPVAWRYKILDYFGRPVWTFKTPKTDIRVFESQPLYTSPPQHTWVGLTDKEIDEGLCRTNYAMHTAGAWRDGVKWAINQLREKNNE